MVTPFSFEKISRHIAFDLLNYDEQNRLIFLIFLVLYLKI